MTAAEGLAPSLLPFCSEAGGETPLMAQLWPLLAAQTEKFTMGESSSVPVETAQELFTSLCYTLKVAAENAGGNAQPSTENLAALLKEGQELLQKKARRAQRLWKLVCQTAARLPNVYYLDTLCSFGAYFKQYDVLFFAHRRPSDLDYPLLCQPSETLLGISYVEKYLQELWEENLLLRRFDQAAAARLLESAVPNGREYFLNLCELPLTNALGRAILQRNVFEIEISAEERRQLTECLRGQDRAALCKTLADAAAFLSAALSEEKDFARPQIESLTAGLLPRLEKALAAGDLSHIFLTSLPEYILPAFP